MSRNLLILLAITCAVALQAQDTAAGAAKASSSAPQLAVSKPTTPQPGQTGTQVSPGRDMFSGKVVLASGEAPSEPILIKRLCVNQTINEGYTDASGHFTFRPGMNAQSVLTEASVGSSVGATVFGVPTDPQTVTPGTLLPGTMAAAAGCSLVADAPGYRSSEILLPTSGAVRNDLGTIVLTPLDPAAADAVVSSTSLAVPKKAKAALDKAVKELAKGPAADGAKAISDLENAVAIYPEYAEAWSVMGQARGQVGDLQGARANYESAIAVDPHYAPAYGPLVALSIDQQDWEGASRLAGVALSMDPSDNRSRWFKAVADYQLQRYDEVIVLLGEIEADQSAVRIYPQSYHIEGLILAKRQKLPEAAKAFRSFLELSPDAEAGDSIRKQLSEWQAAGLI